MELLCVLILSICLTILFTISYRCAKLEVLVATVLVTHRATARAVLSLVKNRPLEPEIQVMLENLTAELKDFYFQEDQE